MESRVNIPNEKKPIDKFIEATEKWLSGDESSLLNSEEKLYITEYYLLKTMHAKSFYSDEKLAQLEKIQDKLEKLKQLLKADKNYQCKWYSLDQSTLYHEQMLAESLAVFDPNLRDAAIYFDANISTPLQTLLTKLFDEVKGQDQETTTCEISQFYLNQTKFLLQNNIVVDKWNYDWQMNVVEQALDRGPLAFSILDKIGYEKAITVQYYSREFNITIRKYLLEHTIDNLKKYPKFYVYFFELAKVALNTNDRHMAAMTGDIEILEREINDFVLNNKDILHISSFEYMLKKSCEYKRPESIKILLAACEKWEIAINLQNVFPVAFEINNDCSEATRNRLIKLKEQHDNKLITPEPTAYEKSYQIIWDKYDNDVDRTLALLRDYTKEEEKKEDSIIPTYLSSYVSYAKLAFSGHFGRHHLNKVSKCIKNVSSKDVKEYNTPEYIIFRLESSINETISESGSLGRRLKFIKEKIYKQQNIRYRHK